MTAVIIGLSASFLASVLLLDLRNIFNLDWYNHLWVIEYFGQCIKHGSIPLEINTQQFIGLPNTFFYAQKFYSLAGLFSAFFGSAITIRLMVLGAFLLQFFHVYRAAMKVGSAWKVSVSIAIFVTWAIYPLTNLYNRSALTEFFAVVFLTCAVCTFLCVIIALKGRVSRYDLLASGYFFVLAAITHPLTALFGGLFLGILGVMALFFCERERRFGLLAYFLITVFFVFLVLSPWVYVLYQFNDKLPISSFQINAANFHQWYFFPGSIDHLLSRLSPFPLDLRSIQFGSEDKDTTPYLDAQITLPLILLMGMFIYIQRREEGTGFFLKSSEKVMIGVSAVMLIISFTESVCPKTLDGLGGFFNILQFPYRLVTYVNLSALVIVILLAGSIGRANVNRSQLINISLAFCIAISFSALIEKLVHGASIVQKSTKASRATWVPMPLGSSSHLNELPSTRYTVDDYYLDKGFSTAFSLVHVPVIYQPFHVLEGKRFSQVEAATVNFAAPTLVITNVQPFPWNQIEIDDVSQPISRILIAYRRETVLVPQGIHRLQFVTRIDGVWGFLNSLSWILLLGWAALWVIFGFKEEWL